MSCVKIIHTSNFRTFVLAFQLINYGNRDQVAVYKDCRITFHNRIKRKEALQVDLDETGENHAIKK